ncbi:hypothetical protein SAMN05216353_101266 [Halobacillus alkaliphilus]|uniref:Uncharacterized protein n=1 Tax=Halobacillus alkaliphilus TaxID=396056 RepID=A0A1I2JLM1_9BACI|nr:hypothetical protein [Halobacillus alkaliphilus]SFF55139.1 hypothetical protein SAMN05216353_101266 [Halobacillus alkaliphilus]
MPNWKQIRDIILKEEFYSAEKKGLAILGIVIIALLQSFTESTLDESLAIIMAAALMSGYSIMKMKRKERIYEFFIVSILSLLLLAWGLYRVLEIIVNGVTY